MAKVEKFLTGEKDRVQKSHATFPLKVFFNSVQLPTECQPAFKNSRSKFQQQIFNILE